MQGSLRGLSGAPGQPCAKAKKETKCASTGMKESCEGKGWNY